MHFICVVVTSVLFLKTTSAIAADDDYDNDVGTQRKCEPITMAACKGVGYNMTSMPNLVEMHNQRDAQYRLQSFTPLVQYGCSSQLQFFLCSLYAPMCTPQVPEPIGPCRHLCENVRSRCAPVLLGLGLTWPPALNCSKLPLENNENHMCMEGPPETAPLPPSPVPQPHPPPPVELIACSHLAHPHLYRYVNTTGVCAPRCGAHITFTLSDKEFAMIWIAIWAVVTLVMCSFTAISLIIQPSVFKYPERSLVHMSICYCAVSMGYLIRVAAGSQAITCIFNDHPIPLAVTEGTINASCALVFLLLYYFSSAASLWWVMLCICWLLRSWRHWTHEKLQQFSCTFHVICWGFPSLLAIACILLRKVAADELTGTCQVGHGPTQVRWVLVPQFIYLVTGSTVVLIVFACLWKSRRRLQSQGLTTHQVDVATTRLGIAGIIYMVPATCLVGSYFYEYVEEPKWLQDQSVRPNMQIFMLKQFMTFAPGIFGSLFLANSRVLEAWRNLFRRHLYKKANMQPPPPQLPTSGSKVTKTVDSPKKTKHNPSKVTSHSSKSPKKHHTSSKSHKKVKPSHNHAHPLYDHSHQMITPIVMMQNIGEQVTTNSRHAGARHHHHHLHHHHNPHYLGPHDISPHNHSPYSTHSHHYPHTPHNSPNLHYHPTMHHQHIYWPSPTTGSETTV